MISQKIISTTKKLNLAKPLKTAALVLAVIWTLFVIANYLRVDNGFLVDFLQTTSPLIFYYTLFFGLFWAGLVAALTYAAAQGFQFRAWLWSFGLVGAGYLAWIYLPQVEDMWLTLANLSDRLRVSLVILGAVIVGTGFGLVNSYARPKPPLWFITTLLGLPFLLITLKARAVANLFMLIWLFTVADTVGYQVTRALNKIFDRLNEVSPQQVGILNIAIGLQLLSLMTLGLGLVGLTNATGLIIFLSLVTLLNLKRIRSNLTMLFKIQWNRSLSLSLTESIALFVLTALFVVFWIDALAPETGPDALGGRVALPAIFLRRGFIEAIPALNLSYMPFTAETIYLLVMPLTGLTAARVVEFGLAVLLLFSAYAHVFSHLQARILGLLGLFTFWSSTVVWWQFFAGFVDLTQLFFFYGAMLALSYWLTEINQPSWLIIAGLSGAAATTVKFNGAIALVIAGLIVLIFTLRKTRGISLLLKKEFYLIIPALLCLLPWLLRSYLLTGNPIYPFANALFKSPLVLSEWNTLHKGIGLVWPDIIRVPWDMFFEPTRFVELGAYHPFLLATVGLALVGLSRNTWLEKFWLITGGLTFLSWLVTEQNARYAMTAMYLFTLGLSLGLLWLNHHLTDKHWQLLFQFGFLGVVLGGFWVELLRSSFWMGNGLAGPALPSQVVLGQQSSDDYLTTNLPSYRCAKYMNQNYGQQAKIWEANWRDHLYFQAETVSLPHGISPLLQPLNEMLFDPNMVDNNPEIYRRLSAMGYTHFLYRENWGLLIDSLEQERQGPFSLAFEAVYLKPECADRGVRLYRIRPKPATPAETAAGYGPNLLHNPGFEQLNEQNWPVSWAPAGQPIVIHQTTNTLVSVSPTDFFFQIVPVVEGRLYELDQDIIVEQPEHKGKLQFNWVNSQGETLLFWWQEASPAPLQPTRYRMLQTAPKGAQQVIIYAIGDQIGVDNMSFREVLPLGD